MQPPDPATFGRLAVTLGFASAELVNAALAALRTSGGEVSADRFFVERGVLRPEEAARVLEVLHVARTPVPQTLRGDVTVVQVAGSPPTPADAASTVPGARGGMAAPPGEGRWELLGELGRGGMGVVYKARHVALDRVVALKVLGSGAHASPEEVGRFRREAQAAARLRHPGIVEVYEVGELDGRPYIAMEYVDGEPLHEHVARTRSDLRQRIALLRAIAEAVEHAHAQGVVHRDLKPGNVLVDRAGRPRVADFGLAKEIRGEGAATLTRTGAVVGTPQYMSPEQADGESRHVDARSDVFSLGVMLYETLAGRLPFEADGAIAVLLRVAKDDPTPPRRLRPDAPADLETVCLRALEKDPARRYASAGVLAAELGRWLDGEPVLARPISRAQRLLRRAARHRHVVAAVGGLLLLAAALTVALALGSADRERLAEQAALDRRQAEAAQDLLRKAALVSKTLARWRAVAGPVRGLERRFHDARLDAAARKASGAEDRRAIDAFLADTPDDPTERATARAFAGWALRLAGDEALGLAWMRESAALDPDVPYGSLLEAVVVLSRLTETQPLPMTKTGLDGLVFKEVPPDPPERAEARRGMEELLERAARARVWGKESAEDAGSAVEALRAWQRGDYAQAEAGLSRALAGPDLATVESGLRLARAQARYLQKKFSAALEDMEAVLAARPEDATAWRFAGLFHFAAAQEAEVKGGDALPALERAEAALRGATERAPADATAWIDLGNVLGRRGGIAAARGEDRREFSQRALAAFDEALKRGSKDPAIWQNRGCERLALGETAARTGGDPRPDFEQALRDFAECLKVRPVANEARAGRGAVLQAWAEWEALRGQDPRPRLVNAHTEFDEALRLDGTDVSARTNRGNLLTELARLESARGGDALPWLSSAVADFDAALAARPDSLAALIGRGGARLLEAELEAKAGRDPRSKLALAIADWERVLAIHPGHPTACNNLGVAHLRAGLAAQGRKEDPVPEFERAVAAYAAAIERNPGYVNAWYNRGRARGRLARARAVAGQDSSEDWTRARADFAEAVRLNPQDAPAWYELAAAAAEVSNLAAARKADPVPDRRQAVEACAAALKVNPRHWEAAFLQGKLLEALDDLDAAIAAYERAAECAPDPRPVRVRLEAAQARRGK